MCAFEQHVNYFGSCCVLLCNDMHGTLALVRKTGGRLGGKELINHPSASKTVSYSGITVMLSTPRDVRYAMCCTTQHVMLGENRSPFKGLRICKVPASLPVALQLDPAVVPSLGQAHWRVSCTNLSPTTQPTYLQAPNHPNQTPLPYSWIPLYYHPWANRMAFQPPQPSQPNSSLQLDPAVLLSPGHAHRRLFTTNLSIRTQTPRPTFPFLAAESDSTTICRPTTGAG